jgi:chromate reductase, NAD(P)H dehydrogenase (quinone)
VSRPFATNVLRNKPVAVVGASEGLFGAVWAQADLRKVLGVVGARVDDRELLVGPACEAFTADMRLRDAHVAASLRAIVSDLTHRTARRAA